MDRLKYDCTKYKTKLEKSFFKKRVKKIMGLKAMTKLSKSNPDLHLDKNICVPFKIQLGDVRNGFKQLFEEAREKHLEKVSKIYEDGYKTIQYLKEASINAV